MLDVNDCDGTHTMPSGEMRMSASVLVVPNCHKRKENGRVSEDDHCQLVADQPGRFSLRFGSWLKSQNA